MEKHIPQTGHVIVLGIIKGKERKEEQVKQGLSYSLGNEGEGVTLDESPKHSSRWRRC